MEKLLTPSCRSSTSTVGEMRLSVSTILSFLSGLKYSSVSESGHRQFVCEGLCSRGRLRPGDAWSAGLGHPTLISSSEAYFVSSIIIDGLGDLEVMGL